MSGIFTKFQHTQGVLDKVIETLGCNPMSVRIENLKTATQAVVNGKDCILLGTNNYLGLTFDDDAIKAAHDAIDDYGTGTTGSRVANGTYGGHKDFEQDLCRFFGRDYAMLFTTGYQANLGFISSIAGKDDYLIIDSDSHASIYDGCKLGDATVIRFRHNDAKDLEKRLARLPQDANKLVIVEGIYSMLGDKAPLKDIVEASKKHNAYIMVDEAHSLGVLGEKGRGLAEEMDIENEIDFIVGTFSKSVGTIGGFVVSNHKGLEIMRVSSRAYMFTASAPPSIIASAAVNLDNIENRPEIRTILARNAHTLYEGLKNLGFEVGPEETPVIGVKMPSVEEGLKVWQMLLDNGVYVNMALPPATPNGLALLRCSVCAAHSDKELEKVLKAFEIAAEFLGYQPLLEAAE